MKRVIGIALAGVVCLGLIFTLVPFRVASAQEKVIELKFANYFPPPSSQSKMGEQFIADLEKKTGGKVKVRYFPGGSLLKSTTMMDGIEKGIADIGISHIEYTPGRMPVMEAAELPLGYPSGWVANQIMNDFYMKFKPKEMDTVHVMWWHANTPSVLLTTKPVRKLEDLKGLTIRAPGIIGDVIKALGGTPAPTPAPDTYDAISKGVIQGAFMGTEAAKNFRLADVAKYITNTWMVGPSYPMYAIINKNSYNKLPPDVKSVFDSLCTEYRDRFAVMWNEADFEGKEALLKNGGEYINLSKQESARWTKAVEPVIDDYVKRMVSKGFAEPEVRSWIEYLRQRTGYWTQKQVELKIKSVTGPEEIRQ
jgi:TRAP-type C4-dicarboxylate transport system substrate-binding protein